MDTSLIAQKIEALRAELRAEQPIIKEVLAEIAALKRTTGPAALDVSLTTEQTQFSSRTYHYNIH